MKPEKALSIKNPWAYLIALGIKPVENRTTRTHKRERIYIHASGKWDKYPGYKKPLLRDLFNRNQIKELRYRLNPSVFNHIMNSPHLPNVPVFAIIGEVDIVDCVEKHPSVWSENWPGVWKWVLENPVLYKKPILDVKGALSFWRYPK